MVYYKNPYNQQVYAYDPVTQRKLITQAGINGWQEITGDWPPPPGESELLELCKNNALGMLQQTDWSVVPDIANPTNNPYLINQDEFIAYRNTVRNYYVNPVTDPVWPTKPAAQWATQ